MGDILTGITVTSPYITLPTAGVPTTFLATSTDMVADPFAAGLLSNGQAMTDDRGHAVSVPFSGMQGSHRTVASLPNAGAALAATSLVPFVDLVDAGKFFVSILPLAEELTVDPTHNIPFAIAGGGLGVPFLTQTSPMMPAILPPPIPMPGDVRYERLELPSARLGDMRERRDPDAYMRLPAGDVVPVGRIDLPGRETSKEQIGDPRGTREGAWFAGDLALQIYDIEDEAAIARLPKRRRRALIDTKWGEERDVIRLEVGPMDDVFQRVQEAKKDGARHLEVRLGEGVNLETVFTAWRDLENTRLSGVRFVFPNGISLYRGEVAQVGATRFDPPWRGTLVDLTSIFPASARGFEEATVFVRTLTRYVAAVDLRVAVDRSFAGMAGTYMRQVEDHMLTYFIPRLLAFSEAGSSPPSEETLAEMGLLFASYFALVFMGDDISPKDVRQHIIGNTRPKPFLTSGAVVLLDAYADTGSPARVLERLFSHDFDHPFDPLWTFLRRILDCFERVESLDPELSGFTAGHHPDRVSRIPARLRNLFTPYFDGNNLRMAAYIEPGARPLMLPHQIAKELYQEARDALADMLLHLGDVSAGGEGVVHSQIGLSESGDLVVTLSVPAPPHPLPSYRVQGDRIYWEKILGLPDTPIDAIVEFASVADPHVMGLRESCRFIDGRMCFSESIRGVSYQWRWSSDAAGYRAREAVALLVGRSVYLGDGEWVSGGKGGRNFIPSEFSDSNFTLHLRPDGALQIQLSHANGRHQDPLGMEFTDPDWERIRTALAELGAPPLLVRAYRGGTEFEEWKTSPGFSDRLSWVMIIPPRDIDMGNDRPRRPLAEGELVDINGLLDMGYAVPGLYRGLFANTARHDPLEVSQLLHGQTLHQREGVDVRVLQDPRDLVRLRELGLLWQSGDVAQNVRGLMGHLLAQAVRDLSVNAPDQGHVYVYGDLRESFDAVEVRYEVLEDGSLKVEMTYQPKTDKSPLGVFPNEVDAVLNALHASPIFAARRGAPSGDHVPSLQWTVVIPAQNIAWENDPPLLDEDAYYANPAAYQRYGFDQEVDRLREDPDVSSILRPSHYK